MALDMWATHKTDIGVVPRTVCVSVCVYGTLSVWCPYAFNIAAKSKSQSALESNSEVDVVSLA